MEVALTFGSVGDIIAVCQLAFQLRHALKTGSAQEYQNLRADLDAFVRILVEVIGAYEQYENSPYLSALNDAAQSVVGQCMSAIQDLLQRVEPKYGDSLGLGRSRGKLTDACRKARWALREKDRIQDLKSLLETNTQRLTLLAALATKKATRVDNQTLVARIAEVDKHLKDAGDEILDLLREQSCRQEQQGQQLESIKNELQRQTKVGSQAVGSLKLMLTGFCEVKDRIGQLTQAVISLQVSLSHWSSLYLSHLDPTKELPVILEDSLGRIVEIPAGFLAKMKWQTMYCLLEDQFDGEKGAAMVRRREYALEEGASGQDLDNSVPFSALVRRGMKIYMTMIFEKDRNGQASEVNACPRCRLVTEAAEGTTIRCPADGCGMSFQARTRRIGPVVDDLDTGIPDLGKQVKNQVERPLTPTTQNVTVKSVPISPADFSRVRIMHTIVVEVKLLPPAKTISDPCPRCNIRHSLAPGQSEVRCTGCRMVFRHLGRPEEVEPGHPTQGGIDYDHLSEAESDEFEYYEIDGKIYAVPPRSLQSKQYSNDSPGQLEYTYEAHKMQGYTGAGGYPSYPYPDTNAGLWPGLMYDSNRISTPTPRRYPISRRARGPYRAIPSVTPSLSQRDLAGGVSRARKHACNVCNMSFTSAEHLQRHQFSHEPPKFFCPRPDCDQAFHRRDFLLRHEKRHREQDDNPATMSEAMTNYGGTEDDITVVSSLSGEPRESDSASSASQNSRMRHNQQQEILRQMHTAAVAGTHGLQQRPPPAAPAVTSPRQVSPNTLFAIDGQDWFLKDGVRWQQNFEASNLGGGALSSGVEGQGQSPHGSPPDTHRQLLSSKMRDMQNGNIIDMKQEGLNSQTDTAATKARKAQAPTVMDRWAQIRENAVKRAGQRKTEDEVDLSEEDSGEESVESRVARIKARVAELTGKMENADGNGGPSTPTIANPRPPSPRYQSNGEYATARHDTAFVSAAQTLSDGESPNMGHHTRLPSVDMGIDSVIEHTEGLVKVEKKFAEKVGHMASKNRKSGQSSTPRVVPKTKQSEVSTLAKHFEQLSQEFEKERMRDRGQRAAKLHTTQAFRPRTNTPATGHNVTVVPPPSDPEVNPTTTMKREVEMKSQGAPNPWEETMLAAAHMKKMLSTTGIGSLRDDEQPLFKAGLNASSVHWSQYDLDFNARKNGEVSEAEDFMGPSLDDLDPSNVSGQASTAHIPEFSSLRDDEQPLFSAGLSPSWVDWTHYDLEFNARKNGEVSEAEDFMGPSLDDFDPSTVNGQGGTTMTGHSSLPVLKTGGSREDARRKPDGQPLRDRLRAARTADRAKMDALRNEHEFFSHDTFAQAQAKRSRLVQDAPSIAPSNHILDGDRVAAYQSALAEAAHNAAASGKFRRDSSPPPRPAELSWTSPMVSAPNSGRSHPDAHFKYLGDNEDDPPGYFADLDDDAFIAEANAAASAEDMIDWTIPAR